MSVPRTASILRSSATALSRTIPRRTGSILCQRHKSGPYGYTQAAALVFSQYGEPEKVLSLHKYSITPSLPPTSILLRTLAAPINPADINQIQGVYPTKPLFTTFIGTSTPSAIPGNEGCFEVLSVGLSVQSVAQGDWVIMSSTCFGTWRTHALAEEKDVIKIQNKEGLTPVQVGTVSINPCTAYRMLRDFAEMRKGDWFIQNGANSSVGRAAIQFGKLWGYNSINVVRERESEEETSALVKELQDLGATKVGTEKELTSQGYDRTVKSWLADDGTASLKLGLNCVGGKPTQALVKTLSTGACLVTYGGMAKQPFIVPTMALISKDVRLRGFWISRWSEENRDEKVRMVEEILGLMRESKLREAKSRQYTWKWDTKEEELMSVVEGGSRGFRDKAVLVFGET